MFDRPSGFKTNAEFWAVFVPSLTGMIGFWATLSLNIPDFTRFGKSQRAQLWGQTLGLFVLTALAEILGCYLPWLWLKQGRSAWLLLPAALCLSLFAYLLTWHPAASGRVYAAYGGVYICVAVLWLWAVDGIRPTVWDVTGSLVALAGMAIIMFAPRGA